MVVLAMIRAVDAGRRGAGQPRRSPASWERKKKKKKHRRRRAARRSGRGLSFAGAPSPLRKTRRIASLPRAPPSPSRWPGRCSFAALCDVDRCSARSSAASSRAYPSPRPRSGKRSLPVSPPCATSCCCSSSSRWARPCASENFWASRSSRPSCSPPSSLKTGNPLIVAGDHGGRWANRKRTGFFAGLTVAQISGILGSSSWPWASPSRHVGEGIYRPNVTLVGLVTITLSSLHDPLYSQTLYGWLEPWLGWGRAETAPTGRWRGDDPQGGATKRSFIRGRPLRTSEIFFFFFFFFFFDFSTGSSVATKRPAAGCRLRSGGSGRMAQARSRRALW